MPLTPEERRLLNSWNTARYGWARFQASSRRATERLARKLAMEMEVDMPRYEVRTTDADSTSGPVDFWKAPPEPVYYVHDTVQDRPVPLSSSHDKGSTDAHCARLNAKT